MQTIPPQVAQWRADTPGCAHVTHLNNAGAALMPECVIRAIHDHIQLEATMGGYEASDSKAAEFADTYEQIARLIHAAPRNIAVVANATAGFVQALSTIDFAPRDAIVTSRCDYTSNQIQYLSLANRRGVEIRHAADLPEGGVDADAVRQLIRKGKCKLVAISWVPTNSGLVQDVAAVSAVCEDEGVPLLLDACQAVGQIPVDVQSVRCDYLTATARKFLRGPRGIGFMYVSDRALQRGDYPLYVDMRGAKWTAPNKFQVMNNAKRFEDWEFPFAQVLGMGAAVRYALEVGIDIAHDRSHELAAQLRTRLSSMEGIRVLDRGREQCAIVTIAIEGCNIEALELALRKRAINTTTTLGWYGLFDMAEKKVPAALRISPHYYNTTSELDVLLHALPEAVAEVVAQSQGE
jgi:selenocysteine lyase/cysteine desulfurase